ncbi:MULTISPECIES: type 1 glutamine amidotransferase domain-containing protein [unclassified Allomuricauda]|uniref:type 1 glutamine amidotransferase domain-containing protein n=1 Tax=unclassified Allomuricauda TaxID=2615049 RepID=UPI00273F2359|nr:MULTISPECIES: type 1 glutamine amidotransferase domain-containing protein [unclassified Allomuricauda]
MFKKYRILKWSLVSLFSLILILVVIGAWFINLLPEKGIDITKTTVADLPYLSEDIVPFRGKILAIVTSANKMGSSEKSTGYELSELARAYYVFIANGYQVDIASPLGGNAPVVLDDEDMGPFDYAFLNDPVAQVKTKNTIKLEDVDAEAYQAVFFAGGKGAMFDFPENNTIQTIVRNYYQSDKVIGAVCHGPAALVNVILDNGRPLLENKMVTGFTNKEELLLIPDAKTIFPFLLEDKIAAQGASFDEGIMYLEQVSHDRNLITGQNPWSTWTLAESMIKQLGHNPKYREPTDEENAVKVLTAYHLHGSQKAKELIKKMLLNENKPLSRLLIAKHGALEAMQFNIWKFYEISKLASYTKKCEAMKK